MSEIAKTPEPPYYAVIFSSHRTEGDNGYEAMADRMVELAVSQPG
ncbi:MAG: antibiotic biosynthesis monooxygenase, partial [Pseudomonadales bacterium]|nr:antibiotic biosynthesis monooxygenase [Pseudomonadales bacterium]